MKLAHQERLLLLAVLLSAIVLVILGALQVRWSRQVSQAARERIAAQGMQHVRAHCSYDHMVDTILAAYEDVQGRKQ